MASSTHTQWQSKNCQWMNVPWRSPIHHVVHSEHVVLLAHQRLSTIVSFLCSFSSFFLAHAVLWHFVVVVDSVSFLLSMSPNYNQTTHVEPANGCHLDVTTQRTATRDSRDNIGFSLECKRNCLPRIWIFSRPKRNEKYSISRISHARKHSKKMNKNERKLNWRPFLRLSLDPRPMPFAHVKCIQNIQVFFSHVCELAKDQREPHRKPERIKVNFWHFAHTSQHFLVDDVFSAWIQEKHI